MTNRLSTSIAFFLLLSFNVFSQGVWTQKANFGAGAVTEARAFSVGNYGYFGGPTTELWRYDPVSDSWTQMAAFIGPVRNSPVMFSIGMKGYIGTGNSYNDFYEYDVVSNTWTQLANFGGSGREGAVGIAIDGKGYIGTGGSYLSDWWEYNPSTNSWTQKANLGGPGRYHAGAFSINGKGYVSTGFNGSFFNDLLEYDPLLNTWTSKAPLPGNTRDRPVGLATSTRGYILTGWTGGMALNDLWEYDPINDTWTSLPAMPAPARYNSCGFVISNNLYIGTGYASGIIGDFWEYGPDCSSQVASQAATCPGSCDGSAQVTSPDPAAIVSYLWSDGQSTPQANNLCAGSYSVTVTDTSGCVSVTVFVVDEPDSMVITTTQTMPDCAGETDGELCIDTAGTSPFTSFLWNTGDTTLCLSGIAAGIYDVTFTDTAGCQQIVSLILNEPAPIVVNFNYNNASCGSCADGTASAQVTGGTPPLQYSWSTGSTLAFINNLLPGIYSCCVTDANGCSSCDSVQIIFPIGLNDPIQTTVSVTPNPFTDSFAISADQSANKELEVEVYDLSGRKVLSQILNSKTGNLVNTSGLSEGAYLIKVITNENYRYFKVIKSGN